MACRDKSRNYKSKSATSCKTCGKLITFYTKRPKKYCSVNCASSNVEANLKKSKFLTEYRLTHEVDTEKIKKSNQEKYGVDWTFQVDEVKQKIKKTNLDRLGVEYPTQSTEVIKKQQATMDLKYGGCGFASDVTEQKIKTSLNEKYGVDNAQKSDTIRGKTKKTNLSRYGTETPLADSEKMKWSIIKKYGVTNISKTQANKEKIKKTHMDNLLDSVFSGDRLRGLSSPNFTREQYVGVDGKYEFCCTKCSHIFASILSDGKIPLCPKCFPNVKSKYELELIKFINELAPTLSVAHNDRTVIKPLELDVYLPDKKFAIEFDGIVWHSETFGQKHRDYHINKTLACEKVGVRLMHIFEHEWINKKETVKRKIALAIGMTYKTPVAESILFEADSVLPDKIYARNCEIREIDSKTSSTFLNTWHIQGKDNASIKLGAFYNGKLVATMTFGKKRVAMGVKVRGEGEYEMYRFCVADTPVVGIASRLLSTFIKKYNPNEILTFADIRYSGTTAFYEKIGFTRIAVTKPNYFYFHKDTPMELRHRFNFRKDVLPTKLEKFDANMTEYQNMLVNGYDRIWDCGNLKYIWKKPVM